jgi:predicted O-methyltransferase YrrM
LPLQIKKFWAKNNPEPVVPTFQQVVQHIHGTNPYLDYPNYSKRTPLPSPWTRLTPEIVKHVLQLLPSISSPMLVVEVGSFVGGSATIFGNVLREMNVNATILCIDTWQGTLTQWLLKQNMKYIKPQFGQSTLFDLFMINIMQAHLQDMVVPFPVPSAVGGPFLKARKYIIDIVYLDSSHEVMETFKELCTFWEVLRVGGVLLGDDYFSFKGVRHDVDEFVARSRTKLEHIEKQWYIQKTPDVAHFTCYQYE